MEVIVLGGKHFIHHIIKFSSSEYKALFSASNLFSSVFEWNGWQSLFNNGSESHKLIPEIALIASYSQYGYEAGEIGNILYLAFNYFHNGCVQILSISITIFN